MLSSPSEALSLVLRVASVGVAISSAELLLHREDIGATGLMNGPILLTRHRWPVATRMGSVLTSAIAGRGATVLIAARLVASVALVAGVGVIQVARVGAIVVALATWLLRVRTPLGIHASGAMVFVVFVAAAMGLSIGGTVAIEIALGYIAAQGCLSYLVAGTAKLRDERWRGGTAIPMIAGTVMWGNRREALLLEAHPRIGLVLCWATMLGESVVPFALVTPLPVTIAILAFVGVFHLAVAYEMGLNSFVWAFPATYPAIIYCWYFVHSSHG